MRNIFEAARQYIKGGFKYARLENAIYTGNRPEINEIFNQGISLDEKQRKHLIELAKKHHPESSLPALLQD